MCQGMLSPQTLACREAPWLKAVELVTPACPKLMQLAWAHPKPSQAAKPVLACPMLVLLPACPTLEQPWLVPGIFPSLHLPLLRLEMRLGTAPQTRVDIRLLHYPHHR